MFTHTVIGAPFSDLIDQVNSFYADAANAKEIILLDFQHVYGMDAATTKTVMKMLEDNFGSRLIPQMDPTKVTLNQLWASKGRIIVFYDDKQNTHNNGKLLHPFLWDRSETLYSPWPNKELPNEVFGKIRQALPIKGNESPKQQGKFFVLQGLLTPGQKMIAAGLAVDVNPVGAALLDIGNLARPPTSLREAAKVINPLLRPWLAQNCRGKIVSAVICDFHEDSDFVDWVIDLNFNPIIEDRLSPFR